MALNPEAAGDAVIVRRARQGDAAAWEALVQAHRQPVFRLAYLLTGSPDDAEDVAQETFLRAFHALDRFDLERPLRPWLLKIAANLARNQRRTIGRYMGALGRWFQSAPAAGEATVEASSARIQESRLVWQAIRRLGEADQQVIYLRYFLELSVEETAEAMGIPAGTVKSRLHRGLERLRRVVEREYPELRDWSDGPQSI